MAHVELICGPAGAGKTAHVLEVFREELARRQTEGRFGTALWLTPSKRSRAAVLKSLLKDGVEVCFSPQVLRFDQFADALLASAPAIVRPIKPTAKRRLLRGLIDELHRRGRLKYFDKVADTPGFLNLCEAFIAELKREEIWPEAFGEACEAAIPDQGPAGRRKNRELVAIYAAYQERLHAASGSRIADETAVDEPDAADDATGGGGIGELYDDEGRFWSARSLMNAGHRGPFRELTCVVVDGFTDFTRTQYEMLAELAGWTERMFVTLALDRSSDRSDLFTKTAAALDRFRDVFAGHAVVEQELALSAEGRSTTVGHLASHLFINPRRAPRREEAEGLRILSCVRPAGEVETVARDVKRRLKAGTSPDEIVVAFRSLDDVADFVSETFAAAGIPAAVDAGPRLTGTGAVRQVFALLDLERDDWRFSQLLGVLNSTLIQTGWPGMADGTAARAVSTVLRKLGIDGGRDDLLSAVKRAAERHDGDATFTLALETLTRLSDALEPLRKQAAFTTWVDQLLRIETLLNFAPPRPAGDDEPVSNESRGWDGFVKLIEEARNAPSIAGSQMPRLGIAAFRRQLVELTAGQRVATNERESGKVRVLSADQVRNIDVPHLYLCGLSEAAFPQSRRDDCLYGDGDRLRLLQQGVPLGHRERRSREEMLLFYGVVTRARRSLTLSYPSVNDSGELLNPSPYLNAVRELFDAEALKVESCGRLDPVPATNDECLTEADLRIVATRNVLEGDGSLFAAMAGRTQSEQTALNIAAAADMATARFATQGLTNYEGVLNDPRNLKRLRQRFGTRHEFSATELEAYACHPFRYFLDYVLGLKPLADPRPATSYLARGKAWHKAFSSLYEVVDGTDGLSATTEELVERLQQNVQQAIAGGDSPLQWALREIEKDVLTKKAARYGEQWDGYLNALAGQWDDLPRPVCFEVPFGNMPDDGAPDDDGEPAEPQRPRVVFGDDGNGVFLRGQIDRIDVGTCDGRPVFNIIDYKLSASTKGFKEQELELGRTLQLAIYAVATVRLKLVEAELYQLGYWSIEGKGFVCGLASRARKVSPLEEEQSQWLAATLDRLLPELVESIRDGRFPVVPDDPAAKFNPDVHAVARAASFRSVAEHLGKYRPGYEPAASDADD